MWARSPLDPEWIWAPALASLSDVGERGFSETLHRHRSGKQCRMVIRQETEPNWWLPESNR